MKVGRIYLKINFTSIKLVIIMAVDPDPHSFYRLDTDPHSICGSVSRRGKKTEKQKTEKQKKGKESANNCSFIQFFK